MYVKCGQTVLFEINRDGKLFRSFATRGNALSYLAAARELCPDSKWEFVEVFADGGDLDA